MVAIFKQITLSNYASQATALLSVYSEEILPVLTNKL